MNSTNTYIPQFSSTMGDNACAPRISRQVPAGQPVPATDGTCPADISPALRGSNSGSFGRNSIQSLGPRRADAGEIARLLVDDVRSAVRVLFTFVTVFVLTADVYGLSHILAGF